MAPLPCTRAAATSIAAELPRPPTAAFSTVAQRGSQAGYSLLLLCLLLQLCGMHIDSAMLHEERGFVNVDRVHCPTQGRFPIGVDEIDVSFRLQKQRHQGQPVRCGPVSNCSES